MDYKGISTSPKFEEYVRATAELKRTDIVNLWRQEKLALFINVYNALVIHAFVVQGPPTSTIRRLMVRERGREREGVLEEEGERDGDIYTSACLRVL